MLLKIRPFVLSDWEQLIELWKELQVIGGGVVKITEENVTRFRDFVTKIHEEYANVTKLWGEEGFKLVCGTVENLVDSLKAVLPKVQQLIAEHKIRLEDFEYTKYNSCEIIP